MCSCIRLWILLQLNVTPQDSVSAIENEPGRFGTPVSGELPAIMREQHRRPRDNGWTTRSRTNVFTRNPKKQRSYSTRLKQTRDRIRERALYRILVPKRVWNVSFVQYRLFVYRLGYDGHTARWLFRAGSLGVNVHCTQKSWLWPARH